MIAERVRNRKRTEEYVRQLYANGAIHRSGGNNFNSNCRALEQLIEMCPGARCNRFEPRLLQAIFNRDLSELGLGDDFFRKIRRNNFYEPLKMMIDIEELWDHIAMRAYDGQHGRILSAQDPVDPNKWFHEYEFKGLSNGQLPIIPYDCVILNDDAGIGIMFDIVKIDGDSIIFTVAQGYNQPMIASSFMAFVSSGLNDDRFIKVLKAVRNSANYMSMIFPGKEVGRRASQNLEPKIDFEGTNTPELEERLAKCNQRQRQAIVNILEAKCRPNLYVLFGPPGTGKTFTLIELVIQIYKRADSAKILICSSSNTCVDFIADLIADTGEIDSMVRLTSNHRYQDVSSRPGYYTTSVAETNQRLVLTTNSSAARLGRCHYDYVIIDEAGHSHIPESLVPLTRLKEDGCLVLAGDPKQLGPTIKCEMIKNLSVSQSLLYHICGRPLYKNDGGQYDERYITKLIDSYRCDPRILGLCSELFYENELNCLGRTPPKLLTDLDLKEPLVFAPVSGDEMRPPLSVSRCNLLEAEKLIDFLIKLYKIGLHPDQIGIITLYKFQKELLNDMIQSRIAKDKEMLNNLLKSKNKFQYQDVAKMEERQNEGNLESPSNPTSSSQHQATVNNVQPNGTGHRKPKARKPKTPKWMRKFNWICKIDTVDAFQGSEREIILISTVRSPIETEKIGQAKFLMDLRRFNVAISRAKWLVVVFGHLAVLKCGKAWRAYNNWSTRMIV